MIGERDVTVADRALTLLRAAAIFGTVVIAAWLSAALLGAIIQRIVG